MDNKYNDSGQYPSRCLPCSSFRPLHSEYLYPLAVSEELVENACESSWQTGKHRHMQMALQRWISKGKDPTSAPAPAPALLPLIQLLLCLLLLLVLPRSLNLLPGYEERDRFLRSLLSPLLPECSGAGQRRDLPGSSSLPGGYHDGGFVPGPGPGAGGADFLQVDLERQLWFQVGGMVLKAKPPDCVPAQWICAARDDSSS